MAHPRLHLNNPKRHKNSYQKWLSLKISSDIIFYWMILEFWNSYYYAIKNNYDYTHTWN